MSVYARFKRNPEGFRALVELLETAPETRRKRMIEVGMNEDPVFTKKAIQYMLTFEDIIDLPEVELAEVMAIAPPRMIAYSLASARKEIVDRFLRCCKSPRAIEIRDLLETKLGPREISGARLKLVEVARQLERKGLVRRKQIPWSSHL